MNLLIDIGNKRIKWAASNQLAHQLKANGGGKSIGQFILTDCKEITSKLVDSWKKLEAPDSVWISSVVDNKINENLRQICLDLWNKDVYFVDSTMEFHGLRNNYQIPGELGVDRWLALTGAKALHGEVSLVVVDAGTAITVDYLSFNCLLYTSPSPRDA